MEELPAKFITWVIVIFVVVGGVPIAILIAFRSAKDYNVLFGFLSSPINKAAAAGRERIENRRKQGVANAFLEQKKQAGARRRAAYQAGLMEKSFGKRQWARVKAPLMDTKRRAKGGAQLAKGLSTFGKKGEISAGWGALTTTAGAKDTEAASAALRGLQGEETGKGISKLNLEHAQAYVQHNGKRGEALQHLGYAEGSKEAAAYDATVDEINKRGLNLNSGAGIETLASTAANSGMILGAKNGYDSFIDYVGKNHPNVAERPQIAFQAELAAAGQGQKSLRSGGRRIDSITGGSVSDIVPAIKALTKSVADAPDREAHDDRLENLYAKWADVEHGRKMNSFNNDQLANLRQGEAELDKSLRGMNIDVQAFHNEVQRRADEKTAKTMHVA